MLSAGKASSIRSATNSGPSRLSISNTQNKINPKSLNQDKDGKNSNDSNEKGADSNLGAEKQGTETSLDTKLKNIFNKVQKIGDKSQEKKNTDPNAPINSEKDPSRFDQVAGQQLGNSAKDVAERFKFSMPGQSESQSQQQNQTASVAQQQQNAANQVAGGGASGGSAGGGSNSGGSGSGGTSHPNSNSNGSSGGHVDNGSGPNNGENHYHGAQEATREWGATAYNQTTHDGHVDREITAASGQRGDMQNHYVGYHVDEKSNGDGTSTYFVHQATDLAHHDTPTEADIDNAIKNLETNGLRDTVQGIDSPQFADLGHDHDEALQNLDALQNGGKMPEPEPMQAEDDLLRQREVA